MDVEGEDEGKQGAQHGVRRVKQQLFLGLRVTSFLSLVQSWRLSFTNCCNEGSADVTLGANVSAKRIRMWKMCV